MSCGFELNSNTTGVECSTCNGAGASISSATFRSGAYAGKILNPATGVRTGWAIQFASAGVIDSFARVYLYVVAAPNANTTIISFQDVTTLGSDGTSEGAIKLNTGLTLTLHDGSGTQIGSASSALSLNTWYRIEIRNESIAALNTITAKLDGTQFASASNATNAGAGVLRVGANMVGGTCTTGEWYFDDIAINDNSGSTQTSYPGAGSIVHLKPNATGDQANGANGAGGGVGWDDMDEVTPDDATSYWLLQTDSSATSGDPDRIDVNCENMPTGGTPILIQVGARVMPATNASMSYVCRVKSQASGTVIEGTTKAVTGTAWVTHDDTAASKQYSLTRYTDPQAGGAWTEALINAMQIGVRAPDGAPDVRITTLWALLEYTPAAGTKSPPPRRQQARFFRRAA